MKRIENEKLINKNTNIDTIIVIMDNQGLQKNKHWLLYGGVNITLYEVLTTQKYF